MYPIVTHLYTYARRHFYSFVVAPLLFVTFEYVYALYFVVYLYLCNCEIKLS